MSEHMHQEGTKSILYWTLFLNVSRKNGTQCTRNRYDYKTDPSKALGPTGDAQTDDSTLKKTVKPSEGRSKSCSKKRKSWKKDGPRRPLISFGQLLRRPLVPKVHKNIVVSTILLCVYRKTQKNDYARSREKKRGRLAGVAGPS